MATLSYTEGRWIARVECERTGEVDAHGPDPLVAMSNLVAALVEELDARDIEVEDLKSAGGGS